MASWNVGPVDAPAGLLAGAAASVATGASVEMAARATRTARRDAPRRAAPEVGAARLGRSAGQAPARDAAATEVALPRARRAPGAVSP